MSKVRPFEHNLVQWLNKQSTLEVDRIYLKNTTCTRLLWSWRRQRLNETSMHGRQPFLRERFPSKTSFNRRAVQSVYALGNFLEVSLKMKMGNGCARNKKWTAASWNMDRHA